MPVGIVFSMPLVREPVVVAAALAVLGAMLRLEVLGAQKGLEEVI